MSSLVPNAGKAVITARLIGLTMYMGWGTGAGAGAAGSTDVSTPATEARVSATSTQQTISVTNDTHQLVATITAGGTKTITNIGVFDAAGSGSPPSGGNLYAVFDGLSQAVVSGDSIAFTARVQYT